jgi:hypothetical protein
MADKPVKDKNQLPLGEEFVSSEAPNRTSTQPVPGSRSAGRAEVEKKKPAPDSWPRNAKE